MAVPIKRMLIRFHALPKRVGPSTDSLLITCDLPTPTSIQRSGAHPTGAYGDELLHRLPQSCQLTFIIKQIGGLSLSKLTPYHEVLFCTLGTADYLYWGVIGPLH